MLSCGSHLDLGVLEKLMKALRKHKNRYDLTNFTDTKIKSVMVVAENYLLLTL